MEPEPPLFGKDLLVGEREYVHWFEPDSCSTVYVPPGTVIVPVRREEVVLGATLYVSGPGPLPLLPDGKLIHAALLLAVQAQPASVATCTLPDPPEAAK